MRSTERDSRSGLPLNAAPRPTGLVRVALLVSTVGPVGYAPVAPGTVGSLAGLAMYGLVRWSGASGLVEGVALGLIGLGVWSATVAERHLGAVDPGPVVIDEAAGMLVTLAGLDLGVAGAALGFVLFRVLDVVKPYPASRLEALRGGWGIMADDLMAAVYANVALRGLARVLPGWGV